MRQYTYNKKVSLWTMLFVWASVLLAGCNGQLMTSRESLPRVHAKALLLNAQPFPVEWEAFPCEPACDRAERAEHAQRIFGRIGIAGHVIQEVYVLSDSAAAHAQFSQYRDVEFAQLSPPRQTFTRPDDIPYESTITDEYALGCGKDPATVCRALLRYQNYVVRFYFDIDAGYGDGLHHRDIEPILRAMDERVAETFNLTLPTAVP